MQQTSKRYNLYLLATLFSVLLAYLWRLSPRVYAACPAQSTARGQVASSFSLPAQGTYRVWSRIKAPDSTNNSFILQIDSTVCGVVVGDGAIQPGSWTWVNYQNGNSSSLVNATLAAGSHSLVVIGREDNVQVDRILFTTDTNCVPTSAGDNCAATVVAPPPNNGGNQPGGGNTTPPPLGTGAGSTVTVTASTQPLHVVKGTNLVIAPATDETTIKDVSKVEYYIDGKLVDTETAAPFTYKVQTSGLSSGSHTLITTVYFNDGTTNSTTQTLNIEAAAGKKSSHLILGIGLIAAAALAGALAYVQYRRGGLHWRSWTLIPAARSKNAISKKPTPGHEVVLHAELLPGSSHLPQPGTVIEHQQNNNPKKPQ